MSYDGGYSISFGPPLTPRVKLLIIATSAVFVLTYFPLQIFGWTYPYALLGLRPYAVTHYLFIWQLATYLFLHAGFFHIIFNLFVLWMFGPDLENLWGGNQFLFFYFFTGVGAALTDIALGPNSPVMTIGCSGALFGLMLAYGLLFPNRPIYMYFLIPIKAKWFVALIGLIEFISLFGGGSAVSHWSHLGGLLFGYLYLVSHKGPSLQLHQRYDGWKRARRRRQFEIYMRKHDKRNDPDHWIN
ncbi:MAG: rhomboid family intramembrane serine protease [Terriglobia bacterium]